MRRLFGIASVLALVSIAQPAWADNTTLANAYSLMPGAHPAEAFLNDTAQERWYRLSVIVGRSYCVETQAGVFFDTSATAGSVDTIVDVIRQDSVTLLVSNDDASTEPRGYTLSRACFVAPATEAMNVRVKRFNNSGSYNFMVRAAESTLFSNWFFLGGDYSAFTLIRNTTNASVSYTVNWRNSTGTIVATSIGTLAGNGSVALDARSFPLAVSAVSGTVEIAHGGPPDAITASTTVLSGTTGLSFDAPFMKRSSW